MVKVAGRAVALPEGTNPPKMVLEPGNYELPILQRYINNSHDVFTEEGVVTKCQCSKTGKIDVEAGIFREELLPFKEGEDFSYVEIQYPDSATRTHHVKTPAELVAKVGTFLKNVYGVEKASFDFQEKPAKIVEGSKLLVTVS